MTNFKYDSFDIVEVAEKCGIYFHPIQRNDVELKALCPFCSDTKYHSTVLSARLKATAYLFLHR